MGNISVPVSQSLIEELIAFRDQRASFEAFKVGQFITNTELGSQITTDLELLLSSSGDARLQALGRLMVAISSSPETRIGLFRALRYLTNESGYNDNPFLWILWARIGNFTDKLTMVSTGGINQNDVISAVTTANNWLYFDDSTPAERNLTRLEAAALNDWAGLIYTDKNIAGKANNRRWIARFFSMSQEERDYYYDDDLIPLIPPDQEAISAPTKTSKDLNDLNRERKEQEKEWNDNDNIGSEIPTTDHRSGEYFQKPTDKLDTVEWDIDTKKRAKGKGYKPRIRGLKLAPNKFNPYSRANNVADRWGSSVTIFLEAYKWRRFNDRMAFLTRFFSEKQRLENQIEDEKYRLKPPPPEVTLEYIKMFKRDGRIYTNKPDQKRIIYALDQLYILLEEGRAYYQ